MSSPSSSLLAREIESLGARWGENDRNLVWTLASVEDKGMADVLGGRINLVRSQITKMPLYVQDRLL